jgi:hypothetical protein
VPALTAVLGLAKASGNPGSELSRPFPCDGARIAPRGEEKYNYTAYQEGYFAEPSMKRLLLIAWILLVPGSLLLFGQGKIPTIVFDSQSKDFGQVTAGEVLTHVFKFTNKGQAVLEIFQVRPT